MLFQLCNSRAFLSLHCQQKQCVVCRLLRLESTKDIASLRKANFSSVLSVDTVRWILIRCELKKQKWPIDHSFFWKSHPPALCTAVALEKSRIILLRYYNTVFFFPMCLSGSSHTGSGQFLQTAE